MGNCCSTPAAAGDAEAAASRPAPPKAAASAAALPQQPRAAVPPLSFRFSIDSQGDTWVDAQPGPDGSNGSGAGGDGFYTARTHATAWDSDADSWHDAASQASDLMSEADLVDALERFEEEQHQHFEVVDHAIEVLKRKGHLVPQAIELAATETGDDAERLQRYQQLQPSTIAAPALAPALTTLAAAAAPELWGQLSWRLSVRLREPEVVSLAAEAASLHDQCRVLEAEEVVGRLRATLGLGSGRGAATTASSPPSTPGSERTEAEEAANFAAAAAALGLDLPRLEAEVASTREALRQLDDDEGWMVSRDDGLRMLYRHVPGTTVHSLKFSAEFDHPVEHLLALAHEFDLIKTWNKFSVGALKIAEPSIFESYVYGGQWMPPPFKNMQGLIHARGIDLAASERRSLLVLMQTVHPSELPKGHAPLPPETPKRRWLGLLHPSCIQLSPVPKPAAAGANGSASAAGKHLSVPAAGGDSSTTRGSVSLSKASSLATEHGSIISSAGAACTNGAGAATAAMPPHRTRAALLVHLDPHIPLIPGFLVNFVLGVLAPYIYKEMCRVLDSLFADPSSEYNRRIASQPAIFGRLRARMAEHWPELLAEQQQQQQRGRASQAAESAA